MKTNYKRMNKVKILILISLVIFFANTFAQVGSPYSQYGLGDNTYKGFEQSKAMGGIGIGMQTNRNLNSLNPASYTGLDSLSVLYVIGFNTGFNRIQSSIDKVDRSDTRLGYFVLGFKATKKWASSIGVVPVSRVDYTYKYSDSTSENGKIDYYLYGSGGLNKIYWSNAFDITKDLSFGFTASYVFGPLNRVSSAIFVDDWINADNTKVDKQFNIYDFTFDFGVQYKIHLKEKSNIVLGVVYENKMQLNTKKSIKAGTVRNGPDLDENFYENIYEGELIRTIIDTQNIKSTVSVPHAFGLGFTYTNKKIIVGADFYEQRWSQIQNDLYDTKLRDMITVRAGVEYTPNYNSVNKYYKKIHYRFGGHFTQSQMEIRGVGINDYGISFGMGFPLRNTKTSFNLSCEFGQRGTLEQNLLKENYAIISLNISLSDIWFVKRKFN
jgi:hypothetical protein